MTLLRGAFILLAMAGAVFGADTGKATDAATGAARKRVVVLGDSITAGYGLDRDQAYPAVLQRRIDAAGLPFDVVNAGVSGDTTAGGLRRVEWALGSGADVLIVALGGNDGLRGIPPAQTAENLDGILRKARKKFPDIRLVVAGMQMGRNMGADFTKAFEAVFPEAAKAHGATLVPFLLAGVGGVPDLNQDDAIHPNPRGQQKIADTVWIALEPLLQPAAVSPGNNSDSKSDAAPPAAADPAG